MLLGMWATCILGRASDAWAGAHVEAKEEDPSVPKKPPPDTASGPVVCKTGVYIKTLRIDQVGEKFEAQFYWWLRVDDIDPTKSYDFVRSIEVVNADGEMAVTDERVDEVRKFHYVTGTAKVEVPYKAEYLHFPFDEQRLQIAFENEIAGNDEVRYVPDDRDKPVNGETAGEIDLLNGDQFHIAKLEHRDVVATYRSRFGDLDIDGFDDYSRIVFTAHIVRNPWGVLIKIAFPLFIVLFLAYLVFFIPDYEIGTSSSLTVTSLLAAIAFQWTMNDSLPRVSYLTVIDKIFYIVYLFVFYAMTQTIVTFNLSKGTDGQKAFSERLEAWSRVLYPISFVVSVVGLLLYNRQ